LEAQSSSLQIKPVLTDPQVQDFTNVLSVYDPTAEAFYSQLKAPHLTSKERLFVGYTDDVPVIIAILFTDQDMSGIFSLITKDSHRCKGFGTEMMKFLMKFAKDNGSNYACLSSSSPEGYKIYQKLGLII
jgi:GNAT superfamily N-acetyltransferase